MAKRGKNKGKGKPQQAAPAQVAPVESLVAAETLDAEAPADDVEAGSAAAVEAAGADAPADAPIAEEAPAKKSGAGMTILIIALLVMAAGAAGAWYTGVIPH